jgi:hypothetical protein
MLKTLKYAAPLCAIAIGSVLAASGIATATIDSNRLTVNNGVKLPESHMGRQKGPAEVVAEKTKDFRKPPTFGHGAVTAHRTDVGLKGPPGRETHDSGMGRQKGPTIVLTARKTDAPRISLTRN